MWHARFRLRPLMNVVAVVAIDCALLPVAECLAGGLLIGLALQIGLFRITRASSRERRFWIGFVVTGLTAVVVFIAALYSANNRALIQWPFSFFADLIRACSLLPEDLHLWLLRHVLLDLNQALRVIDVIAVFEVCYGLPMLLLAIAGGFLATLLGPRSAPTGAIAPRVEAPSGRPSGRPQWRPGSAPHVGDDSVGGPGDAERADHKIRAVIPGAVTIDLLSRLVVPPASPESRPSRPNHSLNSQQPNRSGLFRR